MILHIYRSGEVEIGADIISLSEVSELKSYIDGAWRKVRTYFPIGDKPTHGIVTSDQFLEGFLINQDILRQKDKERIAFLEKEVERLFSMTHKQDDGFSSERE